MPTISLKLTAAQQDLLDKLYHEAKLRKNDNQYVKATYRFPDGVITLYNTGKAVFQGKEAPYYAAVFQTDDNNDAQAGSDEVGTGDFYGPICVCACFINHEHRQLISSAGIRDSKALADDKILAVAPQLIKMIPHSLLILDNQHYNQVQPTNNMNAIKAKMHNQAYLNLQRKYGLPKMKIIDQFTPPRNYFNYLKNEQEVIRDIIFETKAEDKYPAVACASVIARYAFLRSMTAMNTFYQWNFPKGAGKDVDDNARQFIERYGRDKLAEVAKLNFKNNQRI